MWDTRTEIIENLLKETPTSDMEVYKMENFGYSHVEMTTKDEFDYGAIEVTQDAPESMCGNYNVCNTQTFKHILLSVVEFPRPKHNVVYSTDEPGMYSLFTCNLHLLISYGHICNIIYIYYY